MEGPAVARPVAFDSLAHLATPMVGGVVYYFSVFNSSRHTQPTRTPSFSSVPCHTLAPQSRPAPRFIGVLIRYTPYNIAAAMTASLSLPRSLNFPPPMLRRQSCDRCHRQKVRCVTEVQDGAVTLASIDEESESSLAGRAVAATPCVRCRKAGEDCSYSRKCSPLSSYMTFSAD